MIPSKDCFKLNPETVSRISASQHIPTVGRVVEELVWNSIFGCSTVINVCVDFVPKIEVKIDDNGHGISTFDLESFVGEWNESCWDTNNMASKRGITLASLRYMSQEVSIRTKTQSSDCLLAKAMQGSQFTVAISKHISDFPPSGTSIRVRGLFDHHHVRKRAMNVLTEVEHITIFIRTLSLLHYNISFHVLLQHQDRVTLSYQACSSITQRFVSLHGGEVMKKMKKLHFEQPMDHELLKIEGLLSYPTYATCHYTTEYQYVYVNQCYNQTICNPIVQYVNALYTTYFQANHHNNSHNSPQQSSIPVQPPVGMTRRHAKAIDGLEQQVFPCFVLCVDGPRGLLEEEVQQLGECGWIVEHNQDKMMISWSESITGKAILTALISFTQHTVPRFASMLKQLLSPYSTQLQTGITAARKDNPSNNKMVSNIKNSTNNNNTIGTNGNLDHMFSLAFPFSAPVITTTNHTKKRSIHPPSKATSSSMESTTKKKLRTKEADQQYLSSTSSLLSSLSPAQQQAVLEHTNNTNHKKMHAQLQKKEKGWDHQMDQFRRIIARDPFNNALQLPQLPPRSDDIVTAQQQEEQQKETGKEESENVVPVVRNKKLMEKKQRILPPPQQQQQQSQQEHNPSLPVTITTSATTATTSSSSSSNMSTTNNNTTYNHLKNTRTSCETVTLSDLQAIHQVIGQVDQKYILVMCNTKHTLLAFDQHAIHERILFETYHTLCQTNRTATATGDNNAMECHTFSPPLQYTITSKQWQDLLIKKAQVLHTWGIQFTLQITNNNVNNNNANEDTAKEKEETEEVMMVLLLLHSVPSILGEPLTLHDVLEFVDYLGKHTSLPDCALEPPALQRIIASKACRSAVKFGDVLTLSECQTLINQLKATQNPFQCAHGRPTVFPIANVSQLLLGDG